jgi:hypothetical protein
MKKKWIAINLLLLATTVLLGRHVRDSIRDVEHKINLENEKLTQNDKSISASGNVLPKPDAPKIYNALDFSVIAEKVLFFENRSNEEKQPDAAQTPAPEVPPLAQKPILVGTSISDSKQLAFIIDPTLVPRGQTQAQSSRQGDIQRLAQAASQGDLPGIVQALSQGGGMQGIAQALSQGGGMQGVVQALSQGGGMQGIVQALSQGGGMPGIMQALGQGGGMQELMQAVRQGGGMQELMQAVRQGGGIQGLAQTVRQLGSQGAQTPRSQVQIKRVGDTYHGYTITHINAEDIVLQSGSRMEVIPLHEGSKQPIAGKTAIQPTRVVSFGTMGTTVGTASAGTTGSRAGQPNQGRGGTTTANASMPQTGTTSRSQRPSLPSGMTPIDQNMIQTILGGLMFN